MPTVAERKALLFLAAVAITGVAVRSTSVARFSKEVSTGDSRSNIKGAELALERQMKAVDSAVEAKAKKDAAKKKNPTKQPSSRSNRRTPTLKAAKEQPQFPIDVDLATEEELDNLPRVGPGMAKRIVANRDSFGSFGSLQALEYHIRGIGPSTAAMLAPLVTFSGRPRPLPSDTQRSTKRKVVPRRTGSRNDTNIPWPHQLLLPISRLYDSAISS